jgi:hypothetical protein
VTRNLWHSCGRYRLADHFAGKPRELRAAFDRYVKLARRCGPVTVYAQKTQIVLQARVRFASAIVHKGSVDAAMWLKRRIAHPRLARVEDFGRLGFGHHFRLTSAADVDDALGLLMRQAYRIGQQEADNTRLMSPST